MLQISNRKLFMLYRQSNPVPDGLKWEDPKFEPKKNAAPKRRVMGSNLEPD
jgi:hypothetical protein